MKHRIGVLLGVMGLGWAVLIGPVQARASEVTGAGACGLSGVEIRGAAEAERASACRGLERILTAFAGMGIQVSPRFTLVFEDEVLTPQEKIPVYGYFDSEAREIHMLHFRSEAQRERAPWGVPWSDGLAESFLLHEITHLVAISHLGADYRKLSHAWHEFLAYSLQFELMDAKLRERILNAAEGFAAQPFSDRDSVNDMIYEMDPEAFATRSYLSMREWGGFQFYRSVLEIPSLR